MIKGYLSGYAEAEAKALTEQGRFADHLHWPAKDSARPWQGCLVIPAFDEPFAALDRQLNSLHEQNVLVILVINAPQGAAPDAIQRTQTLLDNCKAKAHRHVLLIDRVAQHRRLPPKQGVGLARKIGCDLGLALLHLGRLRSPWLLQSDADVTFPHGYTDIYANEPQTDASQTQSPGALIFPHSHHSSDPQLALAANLYDLHMAYYVAGLTLAGSPYAHHSLGSTIAIHSSAYAAVRGYPKRNAGEDFYLLNKVRKLAPILRLSAPTLTIQARLSRRVPFGTGPALQAIVDGLAESPSGEAYRSYHPECFDLLARAINVLDDWARMPRGYPDDPILVRLEALGFQRFAENLAKQNNRPEQRQRAVQDWFDGLKTLQFIRGCQDIFPAQPLVQTIAKLPSRFRAKVIEFHTNTD